MTETAPQLTKKDLPDLVRRARFDQKIPWQALADAINQPVVWTTAALLGQHPMTAEDATTIAALLHLDEETVTLLQLQPVRGSGPDVRSDPTIYRFYEALDVYGPALKELIHEQFGDGIMSAINFNLDIHREPDPAGDRVVVTFNGKFLEYAW